MAKANEAWFPKGEANEKKILTEEKINQKKVVIKPLIFVGRIIRMILNAI
jgi:hypothetical protein